MAAVGQLEALLGGLPQDIKRVLVAFARYAFKNLRFGAPPEAIGAAAAENFGGALVRFVTASTPNAEVAVEHRLDRAPRALWPCLSMDTVNATVPVLTVTRPADARFLYVKSPSVSTECLVYVE